ncbi:hypothetical protein SAMN06297129_2858 [Pseudooceanicola antarcticus]|uniref:DUF4034 domain-containing protein n=1 Tax=Pseudooceanicola antarcticus TaxID=1247613 RepID=A0A285J646_9RHOB|nr:hypothetical protein [Pseudooceanicola antarcticus]PJE29744.1 hypothetical protein CVM39_07515 [Pseudooceanicola antarcticus]SNY54581.1 hypothetical protein SAMN06297129_2858 [Pseudooceanicola antarcticus]
MRGLSQIPGFRSLFGPAAPHPGATADEGLIGSVTGLPDGGRQIRIRSAAQARAELKRPDDGPTEQRRLLPIRHATREQGTFRAYFQKGRTLVRQDRWDLLARLIRETDRLRETSPAGVRMAEVLAAGARSDMVSSARKAIHCGAEPSGAWLTDLDAAAAEGGWPEAVTVARLHMDLAWLYHGDLPPVAQPRTPHPEFIRHFERAAQLLDGYSPIEEASPMLAEARIALLANDPAAPARMRDDFEDLIDLDPANPGPLRNFGLYMLPRWFGSDAEAIGDAAAQTADRLADIWGDGAYSWIWLDALSTEAETAAHCDAARFRRGLFDILERRPGQEVANLLAGFCALAMAPGRAPARLTPEARATRELLHAAAGPIIEHHMTEIRPEIWLRGARPALALPEEQVSPADLAADAAQIAAIVKARRSGALRH